MSANRKDGVRKMTGLPICLLVAGSLLLAYGVWGLYSGWIVSTWARIEYRPSVQYWITVGALVAIGSFNIVFAFRLFLRS